MIRAVKRKNRKLGTGNIRGREAISSGITEGVIFEQKTLQKEEEGHVDVLFPHL